jgi:hypothetical protein
MPFIKNEFLQNKCPIAGNRKVSYLTCEKCCFKDKKQGDVTHRTPTKAEKSKKINIIAVYHIQCEFVFFENGSI